MEKKSTNKEIKIETLNQEVKIQEVTTLDSIFGNIVVQSTVPDGRPTKIGEQLVMYVNGATYRLYIYNYQDNTWRYATLT